MLAPWVPWFMPQSLSWELRVKHRKVRRELCPSHQVFLGHKGLAICGGRTKLWVGRGCQEAWLETEGDGKPRGKRSERRFSARF